MDLTAPEPSRGDRVREVFEAISNVEPTGLLSGAVSLFNTLIPTEFERRSRQFHEELMRRLSVYDAWLQHLDTQWASAVYATGVLASARSASEDHLSYLAGATANAMVNALDLPRDHCLLLLRLVGDLTGTHVRVLRVLADPMAVATDQGKEFTWQADSEGQYPRRQLFALDDQLAQEPQLAEAIASDLLRLGLIHGAVDFATVFERGLLDGGEFADLRRVDPENPPHGATTLGRQLLEFVST